MPKGEGYWSAGSQHLASKELSPVGANVVTYCKMCFHLPKVCKRVNIFEAIFQSTEALKAK